MLFFESRHFKSVDLRSEISDYFYLTVSSSVFSYHLISFSYLFILRVAGSPPFLIHSFTTSSPHLLV
jgi:hypothetical protein